jgi:hypothetical protein
MTIAVITIAVMTIVLMTIVLITIVIMTIDQMTIVLMTIDQMGIVWMTMVQCIILNKITYNQHTIVKLASWPSHKVTTTMDCCLIYWLTILGNCCSIEMKKAWYFIHKHFIFFVTYEQAQYARALDCTTREGVGLILMLRKKIKCCEYGTRLSSSWWDSSFPEWFTNRFFSNPW